MRDDDKLPRWNIQLEPEVTKDMEHDPSHHLVSWKDALQATIHCLTGCAIGEVLGMVIGTALGFHNLGTIVLSIILAFMFGYALTTHGVLKAGLSLSQALRVALLADTVSIAVMEVIDNTIVASIPGAMDAGLGSMLFWASLAFSLLLALVFTTPVNKFLMSRGKGHAVVHQFHGHS